MFGFSGAIKFYYCPTPLSMRKSFDGLAGAVELESRVVKIALDNPALGQQRVSNELRKEGMFISPGGVRSVWQRHDLETFQKRLKALEAKVAQDGVVLTESQLQALEKAKEEKEAIGEIETEHPGYLIAQDSFYVGNMKGVGRIYQQTVIDTYSKVAFAKLYDRKNALIAADMLNDRVIPFFDANEIPVLRVLTDRDSEYCGNREHHEYELYLDLENIDHTKTKAKSPQTNGICERFHKTILNEFYQITFRKKIYDSIEMLQKDLDEWMQDEPFQKYWLSRVNHLFFRASKPFRRTNPDFFTKKGKKSNFGPFSSSPVNAVCSRYPVVYVSLISSIQAC